MVPLELNLPTVIVLAVVVALMALAVRRLCKRGMCDCKDGCEGGSCSKCSAVDRMVRDMENAAKAER